MGESWRRREGRKRNAPSVEGAGLYEAKSRRIWGLRTALCPGPLVMPTSETTAQAETRKMAPQQDADVSTLLRAASAHEG